MIAFGVIAAFLVAGVLVAVVSPLIATRPARGISREAAVAAVCRDRLLELEEELAAGLIPRGQYAQARAEVERRLVADIDGEVERPADRAARSRVPAIVVGIMLPLASAAVYWSIGSPESLVRRSAPTVAPHAVDARQLEDMIARLTARLDREPGDAEGWAMLARSYGALRRFGEATAAYAQAVARGAADAQLFADYADALAMAQGRRLEGEPEALIARALAADPNHVKALALAGSAAFEKRQYESAISHWQRLLTRVPADADIARSIRGSIGQAQQRLRPAGTTPPARP